MAKSGAMNDGVLLATRFRLGNQVMQRVIQRKIGLPGDYLDDLSSAKAIFNRSTWVQIVNKYRQYHVTKKPATELTLIGEMLTLIDDWIGSVQNEVGTAQPSRADTEKRKRLQNLKLALQAEKPKVEEGINKRKIFEELGVPLSYLDELTSADFDHLWTAHLALGEGDVGKADAALAKLKASIGDVVNMLRTALMRRHLGQIDPKLAKMVDKPDYRVKDWQTETDAHTRIMSLDPAGNVVGNAKMFQQDSTKKTLKGLSETEVAALTGYSGSYYTQYNNALRGEVGTANFDHEKLALTQVTISALNKLKPYKGTCFRHDNLFSGFKELNRVGATVSDMAFFSSTYDHAAIAQAIIPSSHEVLQILTSKNGRKIEQASVAWFEREVLFKPGTSFTVTARFDRNADDSWTPTLSDAAKGYLDEDPFKDKVKVIVFKMEA
ncbi:MAG TPA: ADP-ribosyltransferase domain-containing protein [Chloroflexota bacterium]|nr:ADP-ribosyltransferase domain-containing protein [Chloroflexota bacterium]